MITHTHNNYNYTSNSWSEGIKCQLDRIIVIFIRSGVIIPATINKKEKTKTTAKCVRNETGVASKNIMNLGIPRPRFVFSCIIQCYNNMNKPYNMELGRTWYENIDIFKKMNMKNPQRKFVNMFYTVAIHRTIQIKYRNAQSDGYLWT